VLLAVNFFSQVNTMYFGFFLVYLYFRAKLRSNECCFVSSCNQTLFASLVSLRILNLIGVAKWLTFLFGPLSGIRAIKCMFAHATSYVLRLGRVIVNIRRKKKANSTFMGLDHCNKNTMYDA